MNVHDFVWNKFWIGVNGQFGVFDIDAIKKFCFNTVLIDENNKISYLSFEKFRTLAFQIYSTYENYRELGRMAELNNLNLEEVKTEVERQLSCRAHKAFYGESITTRSFLLIPGSSFDSLNRMEDIEYAVDGLFGINGKKTYIQIKSSSYYNDTRKINEEKIKQDRANLPYPSTHLFYNFDFENPYIMSEYGHKFYFPRMVVDVDGLESFFLERVLK
jgi:hypothetical protein